MTLWIMCGVPGSGKTYFAKHKLISGLGWQYISRDEIRYSILKEEEDYFSHETEVFEKFVAEIKRAFSNDGISNVVADATHLSEKSRMKLLNALDIKNINIIPIVLKTDLEIAIQQNEMRQGRAIVPRGVIRRMQASFTDPAQDRFKYTAIMYVNNSEDKYVEKPRFMYHKNDLHMKEMPIKALLKKE